MEILDRYTQAVNESMLTGIDPQRSTLEEAMHYALAIKGKRLRPLLFLTLLDALGRDALTFVDIAAAIEIIHTYSLIHDDMPCMDDDDLRRGYPTVHCRFNEAMALLTGDTLLTMAFEKIVCAPVDGATASAIVRIITRSIGVAGMAGGQALDLEFRGDRKQIPDIHRMKTAELITGTLLAAARIIPLEGERLDWLAESGQAIGIGFQMADDLLDITGNEQEVGKKLRKDSGNSSPNAAVYFGVEQVQAWVNEYYRTAMERLERMGITHPPLLYLFRKMVFRSS